MSTKLERLKEELESTQVELEIANAHCSKLEEELEACKQRERQAV